VNGKTGWRNVLGTSGLLLIVLGVPALWRVAVGAWGPRESEAQPSYLPALEASRAREAFVADPVDDLRRMAPGVVLIGDSMAGRIQFDRLTALTGEPVAPVLQNASGSAYWYLVLKNYVVASGITPRWVIIFFRDTNLTDVTFRLDGPYRTQLDHVARASEPELNRVVGARLRGGWSDVYRAVDALYAVSRSRAWIEPILAAWPARVVAGARRESALLDRANTAFSLDKLRPMAQADLEAADRREADFPGRVDVSALPLMLDLARQHGLHLCFVRVLRRPVHQAPPPESPELQHYVRDLGAYITEHGGVLIDDRDDPALARLPYEDGDHVAAEARIPYTDRFWEKLKSLPQ
jgi:hypothetical protein